MAKATTTKVIISGDRIDFYRFEKKVVTGFNIQGGRGINRHQGSRAYEYQQQSLRRSKAHAERLIHANFKKGDKFMTLTFDEKTHPHLDASSAKQLWRNFVRKMRRRYGDFKYLGVVEFRDHRKKGLHIHVIADLPKIPQPILQQTWGHGTVHIKSVFDLSGIAKYFVKDFDQAQNIDRPVTRRKKGERSYLRSNNLKEPSILRGKIGEQFLQKHAAIRIFKKDYQSKYNGVVHYALLSKKR